MLFDLTAAGQSIVGDGIVPGVLFVAWIGLAIYGLVRLGRTPAMVALGIGLVGGLASAILVTASWGGADIVPRYFMSAALYGVPLVAIGIMSIRWPAVRVGVLGVLALAGLFSYTGTVRVAGDGGTRADMARSMIYAWPKRPADL